MEIQRQRFSCIGVPSNNFRQEPGTNKEIKDFCETTFGIDFPITEKLSVLGQMRILFFYGQKKIMVNELYQNGIFTK